MRTVAVNVTINDQAAAERAPREQRGRWTSTTDTALKNR
jgi:hypothetical protein